MEPFGLFDLLKTLLPTAQNAENPSPSPSTAPPPDKPRETSSPAPVYTENNPCLDFISRHDAQAKRIKKTDR